MAAAAAALERDRALCTKRSVERHRAYREGVGKGPEAIAFDAQGRITTGFVDGRVVRFEPDGSGYTLLANTGGRPLGVFIHPDGSVIVCDANRGLLKVDQGGKITVLSAEAEGVPFRFTDDLAVTKDGSKVYFTDASSKFGFGQVSEDIIEHGGHGRFLVYDFKTGKTDVLMKGPAVCERRGARAG